MSTLAARYRWMLDAVFVAALLGWLMQLPTALFEREDGGIERFVVLVVVSLAASGLWLLLRRRARTSGGVRGGGVRAGARSRTPARVGAIALTVIGIVGAVASWGAVGTGMLWLSLVVLVVEFGVWWAFTAGITVSIVFGLSSFAQFPDHLLSSMFEALGLAVFLLIPIGLGWLIETAERARHELEATIVERDAALGELRAAHLELERRSATDRELTLAHERERAARDLHDGLGHRLTVGAMSLDFATRMRGRDADAAWAEVERAHDGMQDTIAWLRRWVRALDPIADPGAAGGAAFEKIADAFRGTGLEVDVRVDGGERPIGRDASLLASRIVQEALTNTVRAATATRVDLHASYEPLGLRLRLLDNGTRPAVDGAESDGPPEGFGRRALRERAEELGGTLDSGWTEGGWLLEATIPAATPTTN